MSDLDRILKLASHGTDRAQSQAPAVEENIPEENIPTTEAVGEFAEPIYDLIDMHFEGDCQPVFDDLVRFLSGDQIKEFVDDFRRHHDLISHEETDESVEAEIDEAEIDEADVDEGNEFSGELEKARKAGKKEFKVDGKTYQVENYQDRYNKVASTNNAIKVGRSNATMPQDAVRKVSGDSSYTHADNPFYQAKADARKNDGLGVNKDIITKMKPNPKDGKFKWGRDKLSDSVNDEFAEALGRILDLSGTGAKQTPVKEGTWAVPESPEQVEKLKEVMAEPLLVGEDGDNACDVMYGLLGDDELFDTFHQMSIDMGPDADARPAIEARLKELGLMEAEVTEASGVCSDCGCKIDAPKPGCECTHDSHDAAGDHWVKEEEVNEAQSPAQKAAFEKMLAKKKGSKDDDKADESVNEADDKMPLKADVMQCCKDGMTLTEICKKYSDCDQDKLKEMCESCMSEMKESKEEQVNEAPTMDTTQLINLLKNAGLSEEKINEKLNEWANTPEGAAEEEATSHGEPYENFAQSVNLSLKRYLDAEDMKVGLKEHKVEDIKEAYKASKNKK